MEGLRNSDHEGGLALLGASPASAVEQLLRLHTAARKPDLCRVHAEVWLFGRRYNERTLVCSNRSQRLFL